MRWQIALKPLICESCQEIQRCIPTCLFGGKKNQVESAALQILNILYSVPQLSVRLEEIPDRHLKMIQNWFKYWNENRHILLEGEFIPSNPVANFPMLTALDETKQITTLFEDQIVTIENEKKSKT